MGDIFSQEIEGLVALAAQNVTVEVRATHPAVHGVTFPQSFAVTRHAAGGCSGRIGDLYARPPRTLGVMLHVENVGTLGETRVADVRVIADVVVAAGIEHRVINMPVVADISGTDIIEPVVEVTLLRYAAATAREDAVRAADGGNHGVAGAILEDAGALCVCTVA